MTLDKTNELIAMRVQAGSGYNRDAVRLVFGAVMRDHGQAAVDQRVRDDDLLHSGASSPAHTLKARLSSCFIHMI